MAALSPMMQQYFDIKKQHPDKILFFRLGDFYEMFYDDAILASKELELTLTGRDCGQEERAPMCGVPFHSYENYVARLIAKGYKVAICEQMEDPALAKGLVKRDIIRVVTPGTVIESSMLQDDKNNYIASIYITEKKAGVCFADVSTGTAHATVLTGEKLGPEIISELCRYSPSEVLFNAAILDYKEVTAYIKQQLACSVELLDEAAFAPDACMEEMRAQFGDAPEKTAGLAPESPAFTALAVLLGYLKETQKKGVERLKTVHNYAEAQYMQLSPVTRANLELTETMRGREKKGTLLWVLDKTQTAMGKRLMRAWIEQPLVNVAAINARLDGVEELVGDLETEDEEERPEEIRQISENCWRIQGSAPLDEVEDALKIVLPREDYDTFNGYVWGLIDRIPADGEQFEVQAPGLKIQIKNVKNHMVDWAVAEKLPADPGTPGDGLAVSQDKTGKE